MPKITTLPSNLAYECSSLEYVDAKSVVNVGAYAFFRCPLLTTIDTKELISVEEGAFFGCSSLTSINIGESTIAIGNNAFYECSNMGGDINLPNIENIGSQCFFNTKITSFKGEGIIDVPYGLLYNCANLRIAEFGNVESFGEVVFQGCTSLEEIVIKSTTPPTLGSGAIPLNDILSIYVPDASVEAYRNATNWSVYGERIRPLSEYES
jgi:hypothetical protein